MPKELLMVNFDESMEIFSCHIITVQGAGYNSAISNFALPFYLFFILPGGQLKQGESMKAQEV